MRFRLYVNGEWIASSDDWADIMDKADSYYFMGNDDDDDACNYYGSFPEVRIYDTVDKEWC